MTTPQKLLATLVLSLSCAAPALAADRAVYLPLQAAIDAATQSGKLDGTVKFYLAGTGPKGKLLEADAVANRKTNAFAKKDADACIWAAQSALISLQEGAKRVGANAVTNIISYYRKNEYRSNTDYECHAGATVAGVALRGNMVLTSGK